MRESTEFTQANLLLGVMLGIINELDSHYGTFYANEETMSRIMDHAQSIVGCQQSFLINHLLIWVVNNPDERRRLLSILREVSLHVHSYAPDPNDTLFASDIISIRKKAGLNQKQLAERLGYSVSQVEKYEAGTRKPSVTFIQRFKKEFGMDMFWPSYVPGWMKPKSGPKGDDYDND